MTQKPSVSGHSPIQTHLLSLRDFIATGEFFGISSTSTLDDVVQILGTPDQTGTGISSDITIALYGTIELYFWPNPAGSKPTLILIHTDHLPPSGSESFTISPWIVQGSTSFDAAIRAFDDAGIEHVSQHATEIISNSGVKLTFLSDRLAAVSLNYLQLE